MTLPPDFAFSQSNLQDYVACPRRFELRCLRKRAWPAIPGEPVQELERLQDLGERFHRLVYQHRTGIPLEVIERQILDHELSEWWHSYLEYAPQGLPTRQYPEFTLQAGLAGYRLLAKFDLLTLDPDGRCVIVDWKTGLHRPRRDRLQERMQTRLYPLVAALAAHSLLGREVLPEQIEMVYWFTSDPQHPEVFSYSPEQLYADRAEISELIRAIARLAEKGDFPPCTDDRTCGWCVYRSLCERGIRAEMFDPDGSLEEDPGLAFDFDEIEPIEF